MVKRRRGTTSPAPASGAADARAVGSGQSTATGDAGDSDVAGRSSGAAPDGATADGGAREDATSEWLERICKQVDFYFSDANLRRDKFLKQKLREGGDFVPLKTILQFNRIKALKCRNPADLARAIQKSEILVLSTDKKSVGRDLVKAPMESTDPEPRTVYVEGFPLKLSLDDLTAFFARHGRVRLVDRPRHPQTREPLGHCFVEYASAAEAVAASVGLDGCWHPTWPQRFDGKGLRSLLKQRWVEYKREFKALRRASRGGTSFASGPATGSTIGNAASSSMDAGGVAVDEAVASAAGSLATAHAGGIASSALAGDDGSLPTRATSSAASASDATVAAPGAVPVTTPAAPSSKRRGCVIRISGFPDPQTRLSIRQFVEHAVPVEYCDFETGSSSAHLTLRSAEDCRTLLEDLRLTRRSLGWLRPQVAVLELEEEDRYWHEVELRRAARDTASEPPLTKKARRRQSSAGRTSFQKIRWNPQGVIHGGPTTETTVQHWDDSQRRRGGERPGNSSETLPATNEQASASSAPAASASTAPRARSGEATCSLTDTVAGNANMVQAGLGLRGQGVRGRFKPKARLRAASVRPPPPMPPPPRPPAISSATGPAIIASPLPMPPPPVTVPAPNPSAPLMPPPPLRPPGAPPTKVPRLGSAGGAASSSSAMFTEVPAGASDSDDESDLNFLQTAPLPPPSPACPGAFPKRGTLKGAKAKKTGAPPRTGNPLAPWTPSSARGGTRTATSGTGPMSLLPPPSPFAVHAERQAGKSSSEVRLPPPSPVAVHSSGVPSASAGSAGSASAATASNEASAAGVSGSGAGVETSANDGASSKTREDDRSTPIMDSLLEEADDILSMEF